MMDFVKELLGTVPARGMLIAQHLGQSTLLSLTFGIAAGYVGANFFPATVGPVVPYLVGSVTGFGVSSWIFWQSERKAAIHAAHVYPEIMRYRLVTAFTERKLPPSLEVIGTSGFTGQNLGMAATAWLILSAHLARADIEEIQSRQAEAIVDMCSENSAKLLTKHIGHA